MADPDRVLLVVAPYYQEISVALETGARLTLEAAGVEVEKAEVPGAFEIPGAIAAAARTGNYAGFVALGCVIRGETSHYDHVCAECARGIMELTLRKDLVVGFGVLTVENYEQAVARAAVDQGDKGGEAARAALAMIAIRRRFSGAGE
jgi:6,7-dimethyl-8-ribityllumazine synthase